MSFLLAILTWLGNLLVPPLIAAIEKKAETPTTATDATPNPGVDDAFDKAVAADIAAGKAPPA